MCDISLIPQPQKYKKEKGYFEGILSLQNIPDQLQEPLSTIWPELGCGEGTIHLFQEEMLKKEEYKLTVGREKVDISGGSWQGIFYALMTLRQLEILGSGKMPCCCIYDYPGLEGRAVMLDVSRGKVPKIETLKRQIDLFASIKLNQLQLYIEGFSFAYPSFEETLKSNPGDTLSPEEIRELDDYCEKRFIELVPNQNSLGHMAQWLKTEKYAHLAKCQGGMWVKGIHLPATTLDPENPKSLELVTGLLADLLPCFHSHRINVDMDEPFELSKEEMSSIYLEYTKKLYKKIREQGYEMMMWGDVLSKEEESAGELPEDILILDWGYEKEHPVRERAKRLHRLNRRFYLCPGTNSWCSFTGITDNMLECVRNATEAAYDYQAEGMMITDWGDFGHLQYTVFSYPGFLYGAAGAWNRKLLTENQLEEGLNKFVFQDKAGIFGRLCMDAGRYTDKEEFLFPCRSIAFMTLQSKTLEQKELDTFLKNTVESMPFFVEPCVYLPCQNEYENRRIMDENSILEYITELTDKLESAEPVCDDYSLLKSEIENGLQMVRAATRVRAICYKLDDGQGLIQEIEQICEKHSELWKARNKEKGLVLSLEGFKNLRDVLKRREKES